MSQFHLIAPSGYCINQEAAQRGVQRLLESGHQVENQTIIPRRQQRFAGTQAQRLDDINGLVNLKGENNIVLAVRGGTAPADCWKASTGRGWPNASSRIPC
jgi:muramoyltetrapeptide carboxypeptidase